MLRSVRAAVSATRSENHPSHRRLMRPTSSFFGIGIVNHRHHGTQCYPPLLYTTVCTQSTQIISLPLDHRGYADAVSAGFVTGRWTKIVYNTVAACGECWAICLLFVDFSCSAYGSYGISGIMIRISYRGKQPGRSKCQPTLNLRYHQKNNRPLFTWPSCGLDRAE